MQMSAYDKVLQPDAFLIHYYERVALSDGRSWSKKDADASRNVLSPFPITPSCNCQLHVPAEPLPRRSMSAQMPHAPGGDTNSPALHAPDPMALAARCQPRGGSHTAQAPAGRAVHARGRRSTP